MEYFEVQFPNHISVILKSDVPGYDLWTLTTWLANCTQLISSGGVIYNPKQYLMVMRLVNPDERKKRVAKKMEDVLF